MSGPANHLATIGEPVVMSRFMIRQGYVDGDMYQVAIRRGSAFGVLDIAMEAIPKEVRDRAELFKVIDPWRDSEFDDDNLYIALWCAN